MKLQEFTFHPHAIQVDNLPLHNVAIGRDGVTDIQLFEGVLIVAKGTRVWFTHTSYGTGVPIDEVAHVQPVTGTESSANGETPKEKRKVKR